jgi:hypothetical protein
MEETNIEKFNAKSLATRQLRRSGRKHDGHFKMDLRTAG